MSQDSLYLTGDEAAGKVASDGGVESGAGRRRAAERLAMKKSVSMVVDRIEDDRAALVLGDDEKVKLSLPVKFLPDGVKSGDHLEVTFKIDRRAHGRGRRQRSKTCWKN